MVAASRAKASDRAALLKKLFPIIKKHYKYQVPKGDKPVLETMLYAICLEDSTVEQADVSFNRLFTEFPDLNEVRVSTVGEIEVAFAGQTASEWRAFRVISVLKFIFDKSYSFEFESLRKKTLDLATKQLARIKDLPTFVRDYTLHEVTGAHLIPIDPATARLLVWLGLALPNQTQEQMGEMMKGAVRKADVEAFVFTLRGLAADQSRHVAFDLTKYPAPEGGHDTDTAVDRLNDLIKNGPGKPVKPAPVKKPVAIVAEPESKPKKKEAEQTAKAAEMKTASEMKQATEKNAATEKKTVTEKKIATEKKPSEEKKSGEIRKSADAKKTPETGKLAHVKKGTETGKAAGAGKPAESKKVDIKQPSKQKAAVRKGR